MTSFAQAYATQVAVARGGSRRHPRRFRRGARQAAAASSGPSLRHTHPRGRTRPGRGRVAREAAPHSEAAPDPETPPHSETAPDPETAPLPDAHADPEA